MTRRWRWRNFVTLPAKPLQSYSGRQAAGFSRILTRFVPLLLEQGLDDEAVPALLVNNPAQAFAFVPKSRPLSPK